MFHRGNAPHPAQTETQVRDHRLRRIGRTRTAVSAQPVIFRILLDVMAAARLMGCTTVLSGVTPRTVEAMHAADVSWGGVRTVASLRQAVSYVLASKTEA